MRLTSIAFDRLQPTFSNIPDHGKCIELRRVRCPHACASLFLQASAALKRIIPLFDRVLVERFAAETKTKGGLHLPEKSLGKVLNATVIAVGKGLKQKVESSFLVALALHE